MFSFSAACRGWYSDFHLKSVVTSSRRRWRRQKNVYSICAAKVIKREKTHFFSLCAQMESCSVELEVSQQAKYFQCNIHDNGTHVFLGCLSSNFNRRKEIEEHAEILGPRRKRSIRSKFHLADDDAAKDQPRDNK